MLFRTVSLMGSHWGAICATLETLGNDNDKRNAALIREQLSGAVKVVTTRKNVTLKAAKGGDLRETLVSEEVQAARAPSPPNAVEGETHANGRTL